MLGISALWFLTPVVACKAAIRVDCSPVPNMHYNYFWEVCLGASLSLWHGVGAASSTTNAMIITVNDASYYVGSATNSSIPSSLVPESLSSENQMVPITIVDTSASEFTDTSLADATSFNLANDDVFNKGFLQGMSTA